MNIINVTASIINIGFLSYAHTNKNRINSYKKTDLNKLTYPNLFILGVDIFSNYSKHIKVFNLFSLLSKGLFTLSLYGICGPAFMYDLLGNKYLYLNNCENHLNDEDVKEIHKIQSDLFNDEISNKLTDKSRNNKFNDVVKLSSNNNRYVNNNNLTSIYKFIEDKNDIIYVKFNIKDKLSNACTYNNSYIIISSYITTIITTALLI